MNSQDIQKALRKIGYTVTFRHNTWRECLIASLEDSWTGQGADNDAALFDTLHSMLPSKAARTAFEEYVKAIGMLLPSPPKEEPVEQKASRKPDMVVYEREPAPEYKPVALAPPIPKEPSPAPEVYVDPRNLEEAKEAVQETKSLDSTMTEEEGRARIKEIAIEIVNDRDELAVMASYFQRLSVASWIFQARSIEEQFPKNRVISEDVHQIARMLTVFCKEFWPGSVQALQSYTEPSHGLEGLIRVPKRPKNWSQAAVALEQAMEEMEKPSGQDEYGWLDSHRTRPAPSNTSKVLEEAVVLIENAMGSVEERPEDKDVGAVKMVLPSYVKELLQAARLLRWIRPTCKQPVRWGMAYGKLRWASRFRLKGMDKLAALVDPKNVPDKSWAQVLERDPKVLSEQRLRARVLGKQPDSSWDMEELMNWLVDAFPVFTNPQLAKMTEPLREMMLELEIQDFADADRSVRSRFRKLKEMIQAQEDLSSVELPTIDPSVDNEEEDGTEEEDPVSELLKNVREITSGKKMLFISNRNDKPLQRKLKEDLACDVVLKDGGSSSKMRSVMESVSKGNYDLILMATGFNNHSADALLCRAAKSAGIPYVRVNKGRPLATARAIANAFNVSPEGNGHDSRSAAQAH